MTNVTKRITIWKDSNLTDVWLLKPVKVEIDICGIHLDGVQICFGGKPDKIEVK